MQQWIKETARGKKGSKHLSYEQAKLAGEAMFSGEASDVQIAAFLIAERIKTESPDELLGITEAMRAYSSVLQLPPHIGGHAVDFAGPYTGRRSFLTTIPGSLLLAGKRHTGISPQQRRASAEICNKPEQKRGLKLLEQWISASSKGTNLQF
ncbi:hypothetical protein STZ1_20168 [Bacillus subtilis]